MAGMRAILATGAIAVVLTGCGGAPAPAPDAGGTLVVTYRADPAEPTTRRTLTCPARGGGDVRACDRLAALHAPFAPPAPDEVCTQIYGGPQVLRVTGRWQGQAVDATFRRTNGCEITRYDAVAPVFAAGAHTGTTATRP